ncbi:hypothetical protein E6O75_ATG05875 [Venturia nashicola]|uniref:Uncharacterized protein n=1 Tax=Venturia nashicola TaxID=86259 RepID=A0A4Z1NUV5_9PEZI|nr:hypothetical protein E6O75_ATG05875 [Venturia nashicola]
MLPSTQVECSKKWIAMDKVKRSGLLLFVLVLKDQINLLRLIAELPSAAEPWDAHWDAQPPDRQSQART